ncbi:MAG: hypothetical protein ACRCZO_09345 [Cetobacterium sp.]
MKRYSKNTITKFLKELYEELINSKNKSLTKTISYLKVKAYRTGTNGLRFIIVYKNTGNIIKGINYNNALYNLINELEHKEVVCQ